jgi:hypothetical protein
MRKLLLLFILLTTSCAAWIQTDGPYISKSHKFSAELPQGWMRLNRKAYSSLPIDQKIMIDQLLEFPNGDSHLCITRDGIPLQNIIINRRSIDEEFEHTKRILSKDMLPQEAAEVILDNISSDQAVLNLEVLENIPAEISGFSGFKLVFTYKNEDGLWTKSIFYGFMKGEWFYSIGYNSAVRHYFEKDLETFKEVLKSFKVTESV